MMIVKVLYHKAELSGYGGRAYTFKTNLPLKPMQKVLVPSMDGEKKKALVVEIDVPETEIDPEWAYRLKEIKEMDTE